MANEQPVLYSVEGAIARLTLNRPEKKNAFNEEVIVAFKENLRYASENAQVRVIVITGAGTDICWGAYVSTLQNTAKASVDDNVEDARSLLELFILIRQIPVPVVAAVRGRALAGGAGLASACDLVLASASARFGYAEVKVGFVL